VTVTLLSPSAAPPSRVAMRLREPATPLLGLPWTQPLAEWSDEAIPFVELPVGPSRHIVRFIASASGLVALKELPVHPARREYRVMRQLEALGVPAVEAIGLVERPEEDAAVLITRYLERSFQFRRLFMRLPEGASPYRERLLDAMASLLVELHRHGVFWGDCSLANTLLRRDGQTVQAYLVDAETSEVHDRLSDGQRTYDLDVAVENVAGDLADQAAMAGRGLEEIDDELAAALGLRDRYERLWGMLHEDVRLLPDQRFQVEARLRALNDLGFVIDEVILEPGEDEPGKLRLKVAVADRRYHARRVRDLTGLDAGEGQAAILLNDLAAWARIDCPEEAGTRLVRDHGRRWRAEVFEPGVAQLREALGTDIDPVQAYCDLLEVRWLLSEEQGRDVGNRPAIRRIQEHREPVGSFAGMAIVEEPEAIVPVSAFRE
jgi:tRNA A-37 threonylcarbamoyl transferase component Bud32